jgi:predicted molibdopterin-dependent oxidoreductase YjgC
VDEGRLLEGAAELKAALEDPAFAEMHPDDAEKRAVQDGGRVRVKTKAGQLDLPVRITRDVAAGTVFVPFNQPGSPANVVLAGGFVGPVSVALAEEVVSRSAVGHEEEVAS